MGKQRAKPILFYLVGKFSGKKEIGKHEHNVSVTSKAVKR